MTVGLVVKEIILAFCSKHCEKANLLAYAFSVLICLYLHADLRIKQPPLTAVLDKYGDEFAEELGTLKGFNAKLTLKPDTKSQFCRPRQAPYALRDAVD